MWCFRVSTPPRRDVKPRSRERLEVRSDVKESQERSLEALQSANAPDARSVVTELEEADALDGGLTTGWEIVAEERKELDWLTDIESAVNALEASGTDVSVYRKKIPSWYQGLVAINTNWTPSTNTPLVEEAALDVLQILASTLDLVEWEPDFGGYQTNVFEALLHAEELIRGDDTLPVSTRRYLLQLLQEARFTLSNLDEVGGAAARSASMQLVGALTTVATMAETPAKRNAYFKIAVELARTAGATAVTKAVEADSNGCKV